MKSIDNLTLIQIINRYKDIIGDDLESFIYSKIFDDKIIQSIEKSIQNSISVTYGNFKKPTKEF